MDEMADESDELDRWLWSGDGRCLVVSDIAGGCGEVVVWLWWWWLSVCCDWLGVGGGGISTHILTTSTPDPPTPSDDPPHPRVDAGVIDIADVVGVVDDGVWWF